MRLCDCVFFFLIGAGFMTGLATTVGNTWFAPSVESYPEYRQALQEKVKAQQEANRLRFKLSELDLDKLRRSQRDPVNPAGPVIPAEDRIPVPAEPLPLPVNPKANPNTKDDPTDQPQPEPEKGEEEDMAEVKKANTAVAVAVTSIQELMQLAEILFKGGAAQLPNVDRPEKVFHLLLYGREIGLNYTQSLASLSMGKNGKPSIMGDGALALVMQSGLLEDIKEFWEGEGDSRKGVCIVKRKGFPDSRRFEFTVAQAEQAGLIKRAKNEKGDGPWIAYRDRMLRYRPLGYALRDVFPDVLKGLHLTEELSEPQHDPDVVNTQVRVVGPAVADPPASSPATSTTSESPAEPKQLAAAVPTAAESSTGPVTPAQLEELKRIRALVMAAKGLTDANAQKSAWEQILAPYNVPSALKLTEGQAAALITDLTAKHDPFSAPQSTAT